MTTVTQIVSDLKKIQKTQDTEGIQLTPGGAYLGTEIILHHGKRGPEYQYPIQDKVYNLCVQESLFQNGILGYLDILDTWNMVRNGIILGQELLYFKFCTMGAERAGLEEKWAVDYSEQPLHVYKITNLHEMPTATGKPSVSTLSYRLHFCSPEILMNSRTRVSKTMQGTVSDMVENILKEDLKTSKLANITSTSDLKHIIIPNIPPITAIRTLLSPIAQKDVEKMVPGPMIPQEPSIFNGRLVDYYFWETTRGYNFQPCIKPQTDAELTFTIGDSPINLAWWQMMLRGTNHKYVNTLDTLSSISDGAWGSKQISHNAFKKSYSVYQSNYHRSLYRDRFSHVNKTPVYATDKFTKNRDAKDRMISDWPDGKLMMSSFGGERTTTIDKSSRESTLPWAHTPSITSMQRHMQTYHNLRYNQLTVDIPGISALQTGSIIQLALPDIGEGSGYLSPAGGTNAMWENRMNNLWVITSIRHIITPSTAINDYKCELTLSNTMGMTEDPLPFYDKLGGSGSQFRVNLE